MRTSLPPVAQLDKSKNILLIEEWESREQFELSLDSTKLNTIVAAIELANEAPLVRVDLVDRENRRELQISLFGAADFPVIENNFPVNLLRESI